MDKDVKVTIGIPFYNAGKHLFYSIRSVINQTFADWELILVDDGSTDNSLQIAQRFTDPRIRIIHDNLNRGISFRLNQIISEAQGKYLARMDADDIAFPERLEEQVSIMENDPSLEIIDSEAIIINENNEVTGSRSMKTDLANPRKVFDTAQFIHPTVMFRKSFIEKYLYNSEFDGAEDRDLWMRCCHSAHYHKIDRPLLFYREPGKLNIKSYLFRGSQLTKLFKKHRNKISMGLFTELILKNRIRQIVSFTAHFLNLEAVLIRRRNKALSLSEVKFYSQKLAAAIQNK
jgi:glycosyltransferase involved in cell wall biosynthesis